MSAHPVSRLPRALAGWATLALALTVSVSSEARPRQARRAKTKPVATAAPATTPPSDASEKDSARDLAKEALDLMHQGRWPEAQSLLSRAYELVKAPTIALLEGQALEQMGKLVEARDRYEKAKDMGPGEPSPAFQSAAKEAGQRAEFLDRRIPRITILLERDPADPRLPTITLDGLRLAESEWSLSLRVNPGEHAVVASLEGGVVVEDHVLVRETETKEVQLRLRRPVPVRRTNSPVARTEPPGGASTKTWGIVSLGAGAAGLAVGVGSGFVMLDAKKSLDDQCRAGCPPELDGDLSRFRTARVVSFIGYGVGIAGVAVGGGLLLFGPHEKPVEPTGTLRIGLGPGTVSVRGSF